MATRRTPASGGLPVRELRILNEIARIATLDLELAPMLQRITDALHAHFGWEFVACVIVETERQRFVCQAVTSSRPSSIEVGYTRALGLGVAGEVAQTGVPVLLDDVSTADNYIETMPGARAELCVPVYHAGQVIAALNLESLTPATFHDKLPLVQTIADQVAGAIAGARRYEELKHRASLSELISEVSRIAMQPAELDEMLRRICDFVLQKFPVNLSSILLLNDAGDEFVREVFATGRYFPPPGERWPVSVGVCGRCVRDKKPVLVSDVDADPDYIPGMDGILAEYVVPILFHGRVLGVLNLESTQPASFPGYVQEAFLSLAAQIAGAIEGARLHDELRQHAALLEMSNKVAKVALESGDLPQLLQQVTDYIAEAFRLAAVSILLLDKSSTQFTLETISGHVELNQPGDGAWPITSGVCGRCVREGVPQLITEPELDPDYVVGHPDIRSEYIVPIRHGERILGVLNMESTERDTFTPYTQQIFTTIADQVGGALHLAVLNEQLEDANDKLQMAVEELQRISHQDALTGVANRRRFDEILATEWRRMRRAGRPLTVMLADLDFFKDLNDAHGHQYGDECLHKTAQALAVELTRAGDFVARYGGEEFGLVLSDLNADVAMHLAETLRDAIERLALPHHSSSVSEFVTISIGVASCVPDEGLSRAALLAASDKALYDAKHAGRNCVRMRTLPAAKPMSTP